MMMIICLPDNNSLLILKRKCIHNHVFESIRVVISGFPMQATPKLYIYICIYWLLPFPFWMFTFFESSKVRTHMGKALSFSTDPWRQTLRSPVTRTRWVRMILEKATGFSLWMCFKISMMTSHPNQRETQSVHPWKLKCFTWKSPKFEKENYLNQTSMNLCSMVNFHVGDDVFCFFCWRHGQRDG